jgi:thioredoxin-related protein
MQKILCLIIVFGAAAGGYAQTKPATAAAKTETASLKWYAIDEVLALSEKNPKKIFVDVYTDWCGWCKVMDRQTFTDPRVAKYLTTYFYPVKLNAEQKTPITFNDRTYNFMPEYRSNELAIALLQGKMSYPSIVYLNEAGQLLSVVPGYQQPDGILPILVFFAENYYTNVSWEDFTKDVWPTRQKTL